MMQSKEVIFPFEITNLNDDSDMNTLNSILKNNNNKAIDKLKEMRFMHSIRFEYDKNLEDFYKRGLKQISECIDYFNHSYIDDYKKYATRKKLYHTLTNNQDIKSYIDIKDCDETNILDKIIEKGEKEVKA